MVNFIAFHMYKLTSVKLTVPGLLKALGLSANLAIHERQDQACCSWMADEQ